MTVDLIQACECALAGLPTGIPPGTSSRPVPSAGSFPPHPAPALLPSLSVRLQLKALPSWACTSALLCKHGAFHGPIHMVASLYKDDAPAWGDIVHGIKSAFVSSQGAYPGQAGQKPRSEQGCLEACLACAVSAMHSPAPDLVFSNLRMHVQQACDVYTCSVYAYACFSTCAEDYRDCTPLLCTFCGDSWSRAWEATHLKLIMCRAVLHVPVRLVLQHGMMTRRIQTLIDSQQWRLFQQH